MSEMARIEELRRRVDADSGDIAARLEWIVARGRIAGSHVFLEPLLSSQVWHQTPRDIQDLAIEETNRRLEDFSFLHTKFYGNSSDRTLGQRIATFTHKTTNILFNLIPGGRYQMGCDGGSDNEKPLHEVSIARPFLMGQTLVTQEQWLFGGEDNPSHFRGPKQPVETVSWSSCRDWLTAIDAGFRLPSEAEWEYACRAGTVTPYISGDSDDLASYAWFGKNATAPVASLAANNFGLYDMAGNLWEWCEDSFVDNYENAPTDGSPYLADNYQRVGRGGCWVSPRESCRSSDRNWNSPSMSNFYFGFRMTRSLTELFSDSAADKLEEKLP